MEEIWKDIPGYEGCYQCSNLGNIRSLTRFKVYKDALRKLTGRVLLPSKDKDGYKRVTLYKNGKKYQAMVHRMVGICFIPLSCGENYKDYQINHLDHDTGNNKITNLEWVTGTENMAYSRNLGRRNGKFHPKLGLKLDAEASDTIKDMKLSGLTYREIADFFFVSERHVRDVCNGRYWK